MTRWLFLLFFCTLLTVMLPASPAQAQAQQEETLYPFAHRSTPIYDHMARAILRKYPQNFDFMRFRQLYAQTRQYDPISEDVLKRMDQLSYTVSSEQDPQKSGMALLRYQALVADHLANLGVVMRAAALARADKRFGNPDFFQWVRAGLMQSVTISGTGNTLEEAYDVITLAEETMLLYTLGLKLEKSLPRHEVAVYYNMNEVLDRRTGKRKTVFVDTTQPMRFLEAQKKLQKSRNFDLRNR
ncbi:MAG: hypothetical protein IT559_03625 [Alphaproteobacteria bacterium]|nr:hypothetical protein [Alphaproteobacteria bacterium]